MATTKMTREEIQAEINRISEKLYLLETNDGTFGSAEAVAAVGNASPEFCTYRKYAKPSGEVWQTGPDKEDAPGRVRCFHEQQRELDADKKRIAELREQL